MSEETYVYDGDNFVRIQRILGERPGGYRIDKFYLRRGLGQKPYFWDEYNNKWLRLHMGDLIWINEEGIPVKTGQEVRHGQTAR